MKSIILLLFIIFSFSIVSSQRILQILRLLSGECNNKGYLYKGTCFCLSQWTGPNCTIQQEAGRADNTNTKCDDLAIRLDYLSNISPDFYLFDDDEFPRISVNSIDGSTPGDPSAWTRIHDLTPEFHIFNKDITPLDIKQGALGDCYLLAAYASLANRFNGSVIKNMFVSLEDNANHIYTTRWMVNGKPRYVAVDDWVPGSKAYSSYSHVAAEGDAWPLILEKSYAKIHGNYKIIEGGSAATVWSAISQAPTFFLSLSTFTPVTLFSNLTELFRKNYVVGTGTGGKTTTQEVQGHAYAVLGAYTVKLDNGTRVDLIRYFNPWQSEVWGTNPWADNSSVWTPSVKSQVPFSDGNDGITFSTVEDFISNFNYLNYAEIRDDYDVSFVDVPLNDNDNYYHPFQVNFTYYGESSDDLYIFIDFSDSLIYLGCGTPVYLSSLTVKEVSSGKIYKNPYINMFTVKIPNANKGLYQIDISVAKKQDFVKYFTITSYAKAGSVNFIPLATNQNVVNYEAKCPNSCNLQGRCNTLTGVCTCYFGYKGEDCALIQETKCNDCEAPAVCDTIFGLCIKPSLYNIGQSKYLSNSGYSVQLSDTPSNIISYLSNSSYYFPDSNKFLTFSGNSLANAQIIGYPLLSGNQIQIWNKAEINSETFALTTGYSSGFAITVNPTNPSVLTTAQTNTSDPNQQWRFLIKSSECPLKCSNHGVCSYSTGKCVCATGYIGDGCELVEPKVQCPKNCSSNGVCNTATGTCNCQSDYVGQACDISYRDLVCPNNCSFVKGQGNCNLQNAKCVCNQGFFGQECQHFDGSFLYTIQNQETGKYLNYDAYGWTTLSTTALKWNLTSLNYIMYNNKVVSLYGTVDQTPRISYQGYFNGSPLDYQTWKVDKIDSSSYVIRSTANQNYVLTWASDLKRLTVRAFNGDNLSQKWSLTKA